MKRHLLFLVLAMLTCRAAPAQELVRGQILEAVPCEADASQTYALYIPSNYTPNRRWPVILGFDAGGRGRRAVERYQAAAEKYGYIVAGSNNSRNGPWQVSLDAAAAMAADVLGRFRAEPQRVYTAGMSGGARVAMMLALSSDRIAGVLASSAGFPDEFHETVRFPVFGSMGTNDFNHYEMYALDRNLKSPHRVEMFDGTHEWLPVELATNGVEWMEIQAMKGGLRTRDQKEIDEIFAKRTARADAQKRALDKLRELTSIVADFQGLKDTKSFAEQAAALEKDPRIKEQLKAEQDAEEREARISDRLDDLRDGLTLNNPATFAALKKEVTPLLAQAKATEDSEDRRIARRVLARLSAASRGIAHPDLQALLGEIQAIQPSQAQR